MSDPVTSDGIADRDRQSLGHRADRARLVDQHEARRVSGASQIAGEVGKPDADEHDLAIAQLARGDGGHHLGGGVGGTGRRLGARSW